MWPINLFFAVIEGYKFTLQPVFSNSGLKPFCLLISPTKQFCYKVCLK